MDCPECGAREGDYHELGCDYEQCPRCGTQMYSCACQRELIGFNRIRWNGSGWGESECEQLGWFAKPVAVQEGYHWTPCERYEENSIWDVNRLLKHCRWDAKKQRWVLREDRN